jgi:plasmid maintenance system antidote protein VapI
VIYKNLAAEMARKGITKKDLAKSLNMRYPTVVDKTNGKSRLYLDEAVKIRDMFFPEFDLEYLFGSSDTNGKTA